MEGAVDAKGAAGIRVCGSTIDGSLSISESTGFGLVGDSGDDACAPNTIATTLSLKDNTAGLEALGNQVAAVLTSGNASSGPFDEDVIPEVSGNG